MRGIDWILLVMAIFMTLIAVGRLVAPLVERYFETEYERALRLRIKELKKRKTVTFEEPRT